METGGLKHEKVVIIELWNLSMRFIQTSAVSIIKFMFMTLTLFQLSASTDYDKGIMKKTIDKQLDQERNRCNEVRRQLKVW